VQLAEWPRERRRGTAMKNSTSKGKKNVKADQKANAQLAKIFRSLADESRLQILRLLMREGRMNVTKICDEIDESQPSVSHHLTQLKYAGLVDFERDGKFNHYFVTSETLLEAIETIFPRAARGASVAFGSMEFSMKNK
jgi:ArsR family transcriptional regulator, arsenate/arsenite/antimonite-responsive transcriptional repressor